MGQSEQILPTTLLEDENKVDQRGWKLHRKLVPWLWLEPDSFCIFIGLLSASFCYLHIIGFTILARDWWGGMGDPGAACVPIPLHAQALSCGASAAICTHRHGMGLHTYYVPDSGQTQSHLIHKNINSDKPGRQVLPKYPFYRWGKLYLVNGGSWPCLNLKPSLFLWPVEPEHADSKMLSGSDCGRSAFNNLEKN